MEKLIRVKLKRVARSVLLSPELQLLLAAKEGSIGSVVRLYANDASCDALDENDNNVLHLAVKNGNIQLIQTVLLLYGNNSTLFSKENKEGKRPADLTYSSEILKCIALIETGTWPSQHKSHKYNNHNTIQKAIISKINRQNIEQRLESGEKMSILLSLDGGGVRGLILIRILMHLERKLGSSIWEKIDWVAGTSTGAILALSLAKKHSLEHVQKVYLRLKSDVFNGVRPYNSQIFESFLKAEFGDEAMSSIQSPKVIITTCLTHVAPPQLKLFRNYGFETTKLSNRQKERLGYDDPDCIAIWKAASAAPTYFAPFEEIYRFNLYKSIFHTPNFTDCRFADSNFVELLKEQCQIIDGGIMANNPTLELMTEFYRYKTIAEHYEEQNTEAIGCVISIGAGIVPITKIALRESKVNHLIKTISKYGEYLKNMVTIFIKQLTSSDGSLVEISRAWTTSLNIPFYRFSPPLRKNVELDESRDRLLIDMLWETEYYMKVTCAQEVDDLVGFLKQLFYMS